MGEAIKNNYQGHHKTGQWSGQTNIESLQQRTHPLPDADKSPHSTDGKGAEKAQPKRNIIRQGNLYPVIAGSEIMTEFVYGQDKQERYRKLHASYKIRPPQAPGAI